MKIYLDFDGTVLNILLIFSITMANKCKIKIYLDFDGTVVEHTNLLTGKYNDGCKKALKKLQEAGHEIILNTMRVEFNNVSLEKAIDWFSAAHVFLFDKSATSKQNTQIESYHQIVKNAACQRFEFEYFK